MFWLVLYYTSVVVIPEKYGTLEQCQAAGSSWIQSKQFACIPAAKAPTLCYSQAIGSNVKIVCE